MRVGGRSREPVEAYRELPVNARLAAALRATESAFEAAGIVTEGVQSWLDHMWQWLGVDEHRFQEWEQWRNAVLDYALGGEPPTDLVRASDAMNVELLAFTS